MNEVAEVETRALAMGWQPKEQFKGDPSKWRPAEEYVQRGEELLPIVQASERRLRQENQLRQQVNVFQDLRDLLRQIQV